jgi:transposase
MVTLKAVKEGRMLTVEEHFMMKDMHRKGVSISEIARRTGRDRKTVRKAVRTELSGGPRPRRPKRK